MSAPSRRAMLDRANSKLSPRWQCALLDLARSSVYRTRKPAMPSWCAGATTQRAHLGHLKSLCERGLRHLILSGRSTVKSPKRAGLGKLDRALSGFSA